MGVATIQFETSALASEPPSGVGDSSRLRVLHVINGEDYSGAERVQDLLGLRLPGFGFEASYACLLPNRFPAMRRAQEAALYEVPMRNRFDLMPVAGLAGIIRRGHYALVHTHSSRAALVGRPAAALAGVPVVHHMHCQTATETKRLWLTRLNAQVERTVLWRADAIIAVSPTLRDYLLRHGYRADRIHLVPNGVPSSKTLPPAPDVDPDTWTIGTVAMFRPRKGIEVLLESVAQLRRWGLRVRLNAVGRFQSPGYEHEVKAHVRRLDLCDVVQWRGFCQDVPGELKKMDIFVLPSVVSEAMPMSVLEAMAAGVPVVGSDVDGVIDLVRDEQCGLIAAAGDVDDLARALARLIRGEVDWREMRTRAYQRQLDQFSDVSMGAGVAGVYEKVLCGRAA